MSAVALSLDSRSGTSRPAPVASWTHTAVVVAIFASIALAGLLRRPDAGATPGAAVSRPNVVPLYLSLIAAELALVFYVRRGLRRTATTITDLLGGSIAERRKLVTDVLLGAALWGAWALLQAAWTHWWGPISGTAVSAFLAHRPAEIVLWIVLSSSAGFAEELVFRGYLQRQFAALTGSAWLALVMQAIVFGASHGYQGLAACVRITAFGLLFGAVSLWRRRLRPGVIAHALTDIIAGLT